MRSRRDGRLGQRREVLGALNGIRCIDRKWEGEEHCIPGASFGLGSEGQVGV